MHTPTAPPSSPDPDPNPAPQPLSTKLSKDQEHGKVYGQLVWNGRLKEKVEEIGCVNKKQWSLVSTPDYGTYKADQEAA